LPGVPERGGSPRIPRRLPPPAIVPAASRRTTSRRSWRAARARADARRAPRPAAAA